MKIAEWIRDVRETIGLSQVEAAKKLGVHRTTWNRWEAGTYKPDAAYLMTIAGWTDVSFDTLAEMLTP
jgi:transcriptional regulator with XRE-family HTH domain